MANCKTLYVQKIRILQRVYPPSACKAVMVWIAYRIHLGVCVPNNILYLTVPLKSGFIAF